MLRMSKELDLTGVLHLSVPPTFSSIISQVPVRQLHSFHYTCTASRRRIRSLTPHPMARFGWFSQTHPMPKPIGRFLSIYRLSGVRKGDDLSSFRNSCSACCQNSSSRPSGFAVQLPEFIRPLLYFFFSRICHDASTPDGAGAVSFWPGHQGSLTKEVANRVREQRGADSAA